MDLPNKTLRLSFLLRHCFERVGETSPLPFGLGKSRVSRDPLPATQGELMKNSM